MTDLNKWTKVVNRPLGFAGFGLACIAWALETWGPDKYTWLPHLFIVLAVGAIVTGVVQSFRKSPEEKRKDGEDKQTQAGALVQQESQGAKSPNVGSANNVTINYGEDAAAHGETIPPKALGTLVEMVNRKDLELKEKDKRFDEQTEKDKRFDELKQKYLELKSDLSKKENGDEISNQAAVLMDEGEFVKAGNLIERELTKDKKNVEQAADHHFTLARILELQFDYPNALEHHETAARLAPENSLYQNNAGLMANTLGQYDKAIECIDKALAGALKTLGPNHPDVALYLNNLGLAWQSKGEYDKAIEYFEKALAGALKTLGPNHPDVALYLNNLGLAWQSKGEYDKAIEYIEKALAGALKTLSPNHPGVASGWNNLGAAWESKGEYDKAIEYFEKALASSKEILGPDHPSVALYSNNLRATRRKKDGR